MQNTPVIQLIDEAKNIAIKGSLCQEKGQLEEAAFYYQQALNQNPNLQQVNYNLGIIHYQQGDLLGAYQSYKKAIALKPDDINAYYNLGIVLQNQGLLISAIDSYQQAINLSKSEKSNSHETIVNCYSNWGCILLHQGQSDAAIAVFKEALLLKPDDFTIYNNIGQALLQKSQLDQAITYLKKSLKLEPQFTISLYHLGQVYQSQGLHEKAVKYFQQIIELEPENLTAYSESFYSLMEQGKLSEAMTNLQKAIQNNSFVEGYCKWSNLLAESTDELDKGKVAGANFLKALKNSNFPNSLSLKEISQYLIEIYLHLGNVSGESDQDEQAKIYYKKALELETVTAEEYVKLGKSLVKQNLINSAIIITNLGLETYPEHPEILENLQSLSKSKKAQKKPKFLSSSCERLNSRPWWEQNFQEFNMLHLGSRIYSCSENQTTTNILSQNNSLKRAETETFVAQLLSGRAWVVPQKKYGMINNAIAIINQDNQLVKELSWNEAGQLGCQNSDENKQEIFDLEELPELEKIDGKVAVLSGLYDHVYFHWMVDILPRLEILKLHGIDLKEIDFFLVSNYQMPFQRESLNVLGIPQNKIISSEQHPYIQAKKLIVPSFPGDLGRLTSWSLEFHRQVFLSRIKQEIFTENKTSSFYPERIYISRNNSRYRRVFNEEEVLLKLSEIGFVCIQPDSMNLKEQIAIFSHAKVIIGAHGSGLTNIIFSPRGTKVIELVSPNYIRHYYCGISQKIGLEHYYLKGEDFGCAPIRKLMYQNPLTEDIILNLNSLEKALKVLGIIEKKKILETVFSSEIKASIQKEQQVGIRKKISQEKKKLPMKQVGQKISLKVNSQEIAGQLNKQAELYLKQKELELAKTTCTQALKSQPDYSPACKTLGNVFYAQGQIETAWYWYTKAIEYQPNFAEAYANLGTLSVKKEQWQEAISYYQKALKIQPKFAGVYRNLARIYQKIGSYTEAEKFSIKAEYLEPVNQKITPENQAIKLTLYYKKLGKRLQSQGEVEAAWQSYKKFLSLEKNDPEIYLNIGSLYAQQEQWIEAIKCYQKSLVIQPNYADAYRQLAIAWRKVGKKTKGDNCLYQAYSLEPGKATAEEHLILGNSLLQQKVISQAISCYCRAIELNPNLLGAYESLGEALKLQGTKKPTTKVFPNYWQNLENSLNLLIGENHQNSQGIIQQVRADDTIHIIQKPENFQRVVSKGVSRVISTFDLKSDLSDSVNYLESSLSVLENSQDKRVTNYKEITKTLAPNKPLIIEADVTNVYGNIEGEKTVMNSPKKANNNQIIHSTLKLKEISKVNEVKQINSTFLLKDMTSNGVRNIPNVYIQEAQKYYEEGFYEKAISQCQQAISLKIDVAAAYIIIGDSQKKIGEIKQAESSYKTALEIQQSYGLIYIVLGNLYVEYKILNLVIYCYEKALEIKLKVAENYYKLAMVLTELGETLGVLDFWYQAYSLEPKKVTANDHFNLGNKLYEKGKIAQAVSCYQNSIELNPNLGTVYYNLSLGLKCLGRWDEAVIYYHKAKEIWADKNQNQNTLKVDMNSDISAKLEAEYENGYQLNSAKIKDKVGENKNQNQKSLKVDMNSDISAKLEAEYENGEQLNSAEIKDKVWENKNQNQKSLKGDVNFNISAKLEDKYQNGHQLSAAEIERKSGELLQLNQIVTNQINYSQKAEVKELLKQAKTYYLEGLFSEAIAICYSVIKVEKNSEAYQIMGKAFQQKNQLDNAINCYAQALKLNPNDSGANYEMGNILALLPGKLEEAISYYRKAIEIEPYLTEAYYSLANILVNQNQLEKVVILYEKLIEIQPNLWEPHHNLGDILIKQEKFSEAISAYGHAIKLNPNSSVSYVKLADILAKVGELSQAINAYYKAIAIDPDFVDAYQYLGDALRNKGEKEEAIKVYRKAIEIRPQLWEVHHKLGSLFQETEELETAANAYRKSIELNPDFCWSYNNLGDVLVRLEKWSEATGVYSRAIELNPDFCWSYNNLGDVLVKLEKWPEAKSVYHQAIELNPDFPWNYYKLADVLVKLEDWEGAIAAYQKAIKLDPDRKDIKQYLADAENQLQEKIANAKQQQEANKKLTKAGQFGKILATQSKSDLEKIAVNNTIKVDANFAEYYHLQGDTLVEKGEKEKAIKVYRKAVEMEPESWEVHHKLGNLLQEIGKLEDAIAAYNESIELKPDLSWSYNNLGDVLVRLGKLNEAIKYYQKAIYLEPNFAWSYYNLAELCFLLEKWDEAVNAYRRFMEIQPDFSPEVEEKLNQALHQQVQGKLEQALSYYRQGIRNDPTDVKSYEKALEIKPDDAELYLGLGHAWIAKGQSEKAILAYQKAIDKNPDIFVWSRHNLKKTMQVGGLEQAFHAFRQAAKLNSQFQTQEVEKNKQDSLQFDTQNNTQTKTVFSTTKKNLLSNPQFLNLEELNICEGNIAPRDWELVIRPEWKVATQFVRNKEIPEINKELVDNDSFFYIKTQDVKQTNPRSYLRQIVRGIKIFEDTIITSSVQLCLQNTNRSEIVIAIFADDKLTNKIYQLSTKVHSNFGWSTTNISINLNKVVKNLPEEVHIGFYINLPTTSAGNLWLAFSELIVIDASSGFKPINFSFFPFGNYSKASARLRTWKLVDCLRKAGHLVTIGYSDKSDVYVFQKLRLFDQLNDRSKMQLRELKHENKVVVYDFDDNYVLPNQGTQEELVAFMNSVDVVTVGSQLLADFANKYHPNVFVLENPVDINTDDIVREPTPELKNIAWFGAPEGILQIKNVNIEEKITTITKGGDIEFEINTVDQTLTEFDLLIFPLEPTEWNLAKNANRMIKAIALGVPVLATATPEHRRVAREFNLGNHFLVNYDGNWNEKLTYLKTNFAQVQEEILVARQRALEIYSTQKITKNWFNNVLGSRKRWIPTQVKRNFTKTYQKNFLSQVAVLIYDYSVTKTFTTCIEESEVNWSDFGSQYIVATTPYEQELKIEKHGFQYLFPENDYLEIFKYFQQIIIEANQDWILLVSGNCILTQGIYEELDRHLSKSDAEPVLLLKVQSYGCLPDIQSNSIFDGIKFMINPNTPDVMLIKRSWVKPYIPLIQTQLNYWGWNITLLALNNQQKNNCCYVNIPVVLRGNSDIDSNLSRQYVKWLEIFPPKIPPQMPDITNQWRRIKHDIIQDIVTNFPDVLPISFTSALEKIDILNDELNRLKKKSR